MGYLVNQTIQKTQVRIPQADVLTLDTIPYTIKPFANENNYTILAAQLNVPDDDINNNVNGFGHAYLIYKPASVPIAVYDEAINSPQFGLTCNFLINASHPPNRFGGYTANIIYDLSIKTELAPTVVLSDLIVTVYYFNNF